MLFLQKSHSSSSFVVVIVVVVAIGDLQVPISQGVGVQVNVNNIQLSVNGNWNYREKSFPHLSDHGTLDMNAGMTMNVLIHISADVSTGKLMLSVDPNAVVSLDNLQLKLHGGQSMFTIRIVLLFAV